MTLEITADAGRKPGLRGDAFASFEESLNLRGETRDFIGDRCALVGECTGSLGELTDVLGPPDFFGDPWHRGGTPTDFLGDLDGALGGSISFSKDSVDGLGDVSSLVGELGGGEVASTQSSEGERNGLVGGLIGLVGESSGLVGDSFDLMGEPVSLLGEC